MSARPADAPRQSAPMGPDGRPLRRPSDRRRDGGPSVLDAAEDAINAWSRDAIADRISERIARSMAAPALPRDRVSTWLVVVTAIAMGFLASLGLAAASGANALAQSWTSALESRATVSLDDPEPRAVTRALQVIRTTPGVEAAEPLDDEAMDALLRPWLGGDVDLADTLELPELIDVATDPEADAAMLAEGLAARLSEAGLDATVDAHGDWVDRLRPAAARIQSLAYGALVIIAVSAALMVSLACATALAAQSHVVDVLKLVGARDRYIAQIFVRRFQILAFVGSFVGALAAVAMLLSAPAPEAAAELGSAQLAPLLPSLRPDPAIWARFAAVPLCFALIATIAARVSVEWCLRRQERG